MTSFSSTETTEKYKSFHVEPPKRSRFSKSVVNFLVSWCEENTLRPSKENISFLAEKTGLSVSQVGGWLSSRIRINNLQVKKEGKLFTSDIAYKKESKIRKSPIKTKCLIPGKKWEKYAYMGTDAVGKRVRVYWQTMNEYYEGIVKRYVRKVDEYWILYDDNEKHCELLEDLEFLVDETKSSSPPPPKKRKTFLSYPSSPSETSHSNSNVSSPFHDSDSSESFLPRDRSESPSSLSPTIQDSYLDKNSLLSLLQKVKTEHHQHQMSFSNSFVSEKTIVHIDLNASDSDEEMNLIIEKSPDFLKEIKNT